LNRQKQLLVTSTLRTIYPTKSSKKGLTDLTEAVDDLEEAVTVEAAEDMAVEVAEATEEAAEDMAVEVAEATEEAAEEDMAAVEAAIATNTRRK